MPAKDRPKREIKKPKVFEPEVSSLEDDESVDENWDDENIEVGSVIASEKGDDEESDSYESSFVDDEIQYENDGTSATEEESEYVATTDSDDQSELTDATTTTSGEDENTKTSRENENDTRLFRRALLAAAEQEVDEMEITVGVYENIRNTMRSQAMYKLFRELDYGLRARFTLMMQSAPLEFTEEEQSVLVPFLMSYYKETAPERARMSFVIKTLSRAP